MIFKTDLFKSLVGKYAKKFLYQEEKKFRQLNNSESVYSSLCFSLSTLFCNFKKVGPLEFCGKICGKFCCNCVPAESTFGCRIPENLEKRNPTLSEINICWKGALVHLETYVFDTFHSSHSNCAKWASLQTQKSTYHLVINKKKTQQKQKNCSFLKRSNYCTQEASLILFLR